MTTSALGATIVVVALSGVMIGMALKWSVFGNGKMTVTDDKGQKVELTSEQYYVTQQAGTEPPFLNAYWNNHKDGIYVDVVTGQPLFSSTDKYDSGTGWPSFSKPIDAAAIVDKVDGSGGMERTEVRSSKGNSHLGHVFEDGPAPTGMRYCINSAALRFVPKNDLQTAGYPQFSPLFESEKSE